MKKIELEIVALSHSITQTHSYAVVLGEVNGLRRLPIVIGGFEAQAIAVALEKMHPSRPLTHDLMKNFMVAFNVELHEVIINNLQEGIFFSKLVCSTEHDTVEIDSRTSDAIALAVRFGCPIYTYNNILDSAGILMEDDDKKKHSTVVTKNDTGSKDDLKKLSVTELENLLSEVLENEDYIRAISIRDEIKLRKRGPPVKINADLNIIPMISFPNCKINLGLHITAKRADGYHDIESVFYPVGLRDALEIVTTTTSTKLIVTGIPVADDESNLCLKAYGLLKIDFPEIPSVEIHLHKAIPLGAGLGGGSADGAFALRMMHELFALQLSEEQLISYALRLGSDCPFFIINEPCISKGRGELLSRVNVALSGYTLVLINPGTHVNTGWAFGKIKPKLTLRLITDIIKQPVKEWKNNLINDFEIPVFESYPEIKNIKEKLYEQGAVYASMSGSGSTVYGLFENDIALEKFGQYPLIKKIKLS